MISLLIGILIVIDVALLGVIYLLSKKRPVDSMILREIADERAMLAELRDSVQDELRAARHESLQRLEKMTHIAAEVEQDLKASSKTIAGQIDEIASEITDKLNEPLRKLGKKQMSMESLLNKIEVQKESLTKMLNRAEKLCKFFNNSVPYEEVLEEIEDKKYSDAIQLIAKGFTYEQIASEVGISHSEVRLLAGLSGQTSSINK